MISVEGEGAEGDAANAMLSPLYTWAWDSPTPRDTQHSTDHDSTGDMTLSHTLKNKATRCKGTRWFLHCWCRRSSGLRGLLSSG